MNCTLGIDLGSTTTKAVLLDPDGRVLGRGITNTRSNYHVASEAARADAEAAARFELLSRALPDRALVTRLERAFRFEKGRRKLARVRDRMFAEAARLEGQTADAVTESLRAILDAVDREARDLLAPEQPDRSRFFRDAFGARYLALAETESRASGVSFETLMTLFDKSILPVENEADAAFDEAITAAAGDGAPDLRIAIERARALPLNVVNMAGTGYGRQRLPFRKEQIRSEILCHGLGAHAMYPRTRTVLDIGGQDTKAIQVDDRGVVTSFQMNDRCAAGCGRYLGYIADEMNLGLHELGPLALCAKRCTPITSTCTVFAGAELRDLQSLGEPREDILSGLHRAIIVRAMSLLARSGGVSNEMTFTGGVAKNPAAVRFLRELVNRHYGELTLNVDPDSIYTGALGAALFARREAA